LAQAAKSIASVQVQNRGTLVGNVCSAIPSADSAPALLCLGAKLVCTSQAGDRIVALDKFFTAPNLTDLCLDEIVKEIQVPPMMSGGSSIYLKFSPRSKMDCALVGVGVVASTDNGVVRDLKIGLGAVASTPIRALKAEQILMGKPIKDELVAEAAGTAAAESMPINDHRASAEYRRMMVEVLVKRAVHLVLADKK
jgi:carbon-monoxide dehydrogenase medium subunit